MLSVSVLALSSRDPRIKANRCRHHEPVVIVRVLADQIDSARCAKNVRLGSELFPKREVRQSAVDSRFKTLPIMASFRGLDRGIRRAWGATLNRIRPVCQGHHDDAEDQQHHPPGQVDIPTKENARISLFTLTAPNPANSSPRITKSSPIGRRMSGPLRLLSEDNIQNQRHSKHSNSQIAGVLYQGK